MSHFEELGGEAKLRVIIDEFVERICTDMMIGFLFARVDRARLARLEYEHAAQFLGAQVFYSGRPLHAAHKRHTIFGGQFARRRQILKQTLEKHGVAAPIVAAWLAHQDALRGEILGDPLRTCSAESAEGAAPYPSEEENKR